ncbi:MAG: 50S ribosomal protein L6 [Candidatus Omnitrophica bacterium]|nr:50S ribosomal protein L6 [Candidatus Omnitrophota bacterium]
MSRIGKKPVTLPEKVNATLKDRTIHFEGPKGKHDFVLPKGINAKIEGGQVWVERLSDEKPIKSLHGTIRALLNNVVIGITTGFKRELEIIGMGYKAQMKGNTLALSIGFSHPVELPVPEGLTTKVEGQTRIVIEGNDKQQLGQFAAKIRSLYPPEPYKGKGIRYVGEEVRKKLGKAMTK